MGISPKFHSFIAFDEANSAFALLMADLVWGIPSWLNEHSPIFKELSQDQSTVTIEGKKYTPYAFALQTLRKNFSQLSAPEASALHIYFSDLLQKFQSQDQTISQSARNRIERFRLLAHDHKTDELLANFSTMHDPSVYGAVLYYASRGKFRFFKEFADIFRGKKQNLEIAGKTIYLGYGKDADPLQFTKALIKLTKPDTDLSKVIKQTQRSALKECPSCYGYQTGYQSQVEVQQATQSTNQRQEQETENNHPKRQFAQQINQHYLPNFFFSTN